MRDATDLKVGHYKSQPKLYGRFALIMATGNFAHDRSYEILGVAK